MTAEVFGMNLRSIREAQGVTQAELVSYMRECGIEYMNSSTLSRIESGARPVRLSEALVIARIFRVDVERMAGEGRAHEFAPHDELVALREFRRRVLRAVGEAS